MRSTKAPELAGFLDGVTTTRNDIAALEKARALDRLDPVHYLRFLKAFAPKHPPTREIPTRHEPFVL